LDERSAKLAFKLVPFVALLIAGVWLVVLASATVGTAGEGTIFYLPLGIGISLVALTK
jgi:hypothetical protein